MTLAAGKTIGRYEILSLLGAGGMGEVYRARDLTLRREIGSRSCPTPLPGTPDAFYGFGAKPKYLASLNHPHIATIYDIGESGDDRFLVLELIEGETLADRLARGPLTVAESLRMGAQIARAVEAAHEKGITHRDLKPANIQLTPAGDVKVLDFGLAKAVAGGAVASASPTTLAATSLGMIVGTAPYISPEHAKGMDVGTSGDIWAFGCVLYEMLCGRRAFDGDSVSEILASVLMGDPDWERLPSLPDPIATLLRRCLQKDRGHRLQSIGDARIEIEDVLTDPRRLARPPSGAAHKRPYAWMVAVGVTALIALVAGAAALRQVPAPPRNAPRGRSAGDHESGVTGNLTRWTAAGVCRRIR